MAIEEEPKEPVRPHTADASTVRKSPKQPSILGARLGRLDLAKTGESIATKASDRTADSDRLASTTPRLPTVDSGLTKRISRRYKAEVEKVERQRLQAYVPLDQRGMIMPDKHELARTVKGDLDVILKKAGSETVPWDSTFSTDDMQKRMQFLGGHAENGPSKEELDKGGQYHGEFLYGLRHGEGKHEYQNEVYDGAWMWDRRHGPGTLMQSDKSKIRGVWKEGKLEGSVTIQNEAGETIFEGEFKDGKRHGLGRQVFPNGDVYDGGWKQGLLHDRGVYHFSNGDRLIGMWREGRYDGAAMLHFNDGSVSRRVYRDGVLLTSQDYQLDMQKFNKEVNRDVMQTHTTLWEYPKHAIE